MSHNMNYGVQTQLLDEDLAKALVSTVPGGCIDFDGYQSALPLNLGPKKCTCSSTK
jgi:hypothetical protein